MSLSWNLGTLTSWNPLGHSRPVTGLLLPLPICTGASVQNLCVRMVGVFSDTIQILLSDLNLSVNAALNSKQVSFCNTDEDRNFVQGERQVLLVITTQ